ncbi:MAG TPA: Hsp20/alpha crystallin family protein [Pontiellaceae bacterium]|nr:Hsp20/alpha crystallin family protein [Pontiellaceae bacterium]
MKTIHLKPCSAGATLALLLTASTACAGNTNGNVEVKTEAAAQNAPAEQQAPDYLDPVREMIRMNREMDRFFGQPFASFSVMPRMAAELEGQFAKPDMDLREQAEAYYVQLDLPGMDKSAISVEVKDNILTVKAERKQETAKKGGDRVLMQERSSGFMSRAVMLSKPVDAEKVTAEYKDGVLKVTLPKVHADQAPKQVQIK